MTVRLKVLIPAKILESSQTTQYTATGITARIDKFTATNYSGSTVTVSVNIVTNSDTAGNQNLIVKTRSLLAGETYTFPELVGTTLEAGGFISAVASAATSVNIRASGVEVTNA